MMLSTVGFCRKSDKFLHWPFLCVDGTEHAVGVSHEGSQGTMSIHAVLADLHVPQAA